MTIYQIGFLLTSISVSGLILFIWLYHKSKYNKIKRAWYSFFIFIFTLSSIIQPITWFVSVPKNRIEKVETVELNVKNVFKGYSYIFVEYDDGYDIYTEIVDYKEINDSTTKFYVEHTYNKFGDVIETVKYYKND